MKKVKLKEVLKNYKNKHMIQNDKTYRQVTISQTGEISFRGEKHGTKIGRKRQFLIDLKKHPNTLIFIRQGVMKGGIGICPPEVDGCVVTENMPMFEIVGVEPDYLLNFIKSPMFKEDVSKLVPIGTAQKALHENKLLEIEIPYPSKEKQKEIVKKIQSIEKEIKQLENKSSYDKTLLTSLRQSILSEAIQGKLIKQNPKDEPASELLKKIKAEKEKLIKEGKIKKQKELPVISEDEIPYDLPSGWVWCRLGEVCWINPRNNGLDNNLEVSFIPMNLIKDNARNSFEQQIKKWGVIKSGFTHFSEEDVIFAKITPCFQNRNSAILRNLKNKYGAGTTELYVLRGYGKLILTEFLFLLVNTKNFIDKGVATYKGTAGQQRIKRNFVENYIIGLPPLPEQKRIVEKVDALMRFCDELEERIKENKVNSDGLMNGVLREIFESK